MTAGQGVQAKVDRGFWDHHFLKMNSVHWTLTRIAFLAIRRELQYFCWYEAPQNILKSTKPAILVASAKPAILVATKITTEKFLVAFVI